MSPIQQMLLGAGAVATKTYVDDVFSTFLYTGTSANQAINNGIDLSGKGGMTWLKSRNQNYDNWLFDTERGSNKPIRSNLSNAEFTDTAYMNAFNNNGFTVGSNGSTNYTGIDFASWTFRKAPGFFDCVSWTGNSDTNQTISHSLSSVPGMIIAKRTDSSTTGDWVVYHRDHEGYLKLNSTAAAVSDSGAWTPVTSTSFKAYDYINVNGATYVAYIFAGGESTAATARSVVFDNDADRISIGDSSNKSSDLNFGSSDFTWECWIKADATQSSYPRIIHNNTSNTAWGPNASMIIWDHGSQLNRMSFFAYNLSASGSDPTVKSAVKGWNGDGQWHHVAVTRSGNIFRLFSDGVLEDTATSTGSLDNGDAYMGIGQLPDGTANSESFRGSISNVRIVKGTAVYTSSFKPSTVPLTNITNTKLLCCNNSSVTGSTVTPLTISANNSPTASTDSPFDDPSGFVFGDSGDQNVIKCGTYTTDSNEDATINLGWEPQWVLGKRTDSSTGGDWFIIDSMRGFNNAQDIEANNGGSEYLEPNTTDEEDNTSRMGLTSTGFYADQFGSNRSFIYMAIRRPDGYTGKPIELGTNVFAMDNGNPNSKPGFTSGFPVDFYLYRDPTANSGWQGDWGTYVRLNLKKKLWTNKSDAQGSDSSATFAFSDGVQDYDGFGTDFQAWMWKRHAGMDVVTYKGNGSSSNREIAHSLNKSPQMMFIKSRSNAQPWAVYHSSQGAGKYFDGIGTGGISTGNTRFGGVEPTSTHFTLGTSGDVNYDTYTYIALLFTSVDSVSKVGSYTGNGNSSGPTVTLGFAPRFILIKCTTGGTNWYLFDTIRGLSSGDDKRISINESSSQDTGEYITPSSTGFQPATTWDQLNGNNEIYTYYAHA